MAWQDMPPRSGESDVHDYDWITQFWKAVRERQCVLHNTTVWPPSSFSYSQGDVTSVVVDPTDNTRLRIYCADASDYLGQGWIDALGNKRWTNCTQFDLNNNDTVDGNDAEQFLFLPPNYKVTLYKKDDGTPSATRLADPNLGRTYDIIDNGIDAGVHYLVIANDGVLEINGLTLSAYADRWAYSIVRQGDGSQAGFGWVERYPQRPNHPELEWGLITNDLTDPNPLNHKISTTSRIYDTRDLGDQNWNCPRAWSTNKWVGKHIVLRVGSKWVRTLVTASGPDYIDFATQASIPTGEYWIVETWAWWRPEFALSLASVMTRTGERQWVRNDRHPWAPLTWYAGMLDGDFTTHHPDSDDLVSVSLPKESIVLELDEVSPENCGLEAEETIPVFDVDSNTSLDYSNPREFCGNSDRMFNPNLFHGWRGLQVAVESISGRFIAPVDYAGAKHIENFTAATWWKYHCPANTRMASIIGVDDTSKVMTIAAVAMPTKTDLTASGNYASWAGELDYTILDDEGKIYRNGKCQLTSSTTVVRRDVDGGDNPLDFDDTDEGKTIVISFGWTRHYPRQFTKLYERQYFIPEIDDEDEVVLPIEHSIGSWNKDLPSTNYAEFQKLGYLREYGDAFVTGESARYAGYNYSDPCEWASGKQGEWEDGGRYNGLPNLETNFPRFEGLDRSGTVSSAGSFWIEDDAQLWWYSANPLVTHTGVGTAGSTDEVLKDSTLYANWPNNDDPPTTTLRVSNFWTDPNRFVDMILEVAVSGDGTPGDPYVWERRAITAQTVAGNVPQVSVSIPFSGTTFDRPYKIREAGYTDRYGSVRNLWRGRKLTVTKADESATASALITHSDDTRLYFEDDAFPFTIETGDHYEIVQIEAGAVLQRRPGHANAVNGWALPEDAVPDSRNDGNNPWRTGAGGALENLPTVVNSFGRIRKGDYVNHHIFNEVYTAIDCLRWTKGTGGSWYARDLDDVEVNNIKGAGQEEGGRAVPPPDPTDDQELRNVIDTAYAATSGGPGFDGSPPSAEAWSSCDTEFNNINKQRNYSFLAPNLPVTTKLQAQVQCYAYCGNPIETDNGGPTPAEAGSTSVFDSFGQGFEPQAWAPAGLPVDSLALGPTPRVKIGDVDPDWGRLLVIYDNQAYDDQRLLDSSYRGYAITDTLTIEKWDGDGGLTYVS